ncbi:MAG: dockerin type I repeat-containing protein, partial [Clostridia bacterium]|nr:dockerin type I repeat-containing protein [Clostridia bacterium]
MKKPITIAVLLALALTVLFSLCAFAVNAETFLLGDVNGNGKIDAQDYAMCKRAFLRTFSLNGAQLARADINGNGKVDASEYAM